MRGASAAVVLIAAALAMVGPATVANEGDANTSNTLNTSAACGRCHADVVVAWQRSRHAVAASNTVFWTSWTRRPDGWCLRCHAPLPDAQRAILGVPAIDGVVYGSMMRRSPPAPVGVDCAACHLDSDGILRSGKQPSTLALSAHPMRQDLSLADERLCARCHEFPFQRHRPLFPFSVSENPSQATVSEWRAAHAGATTTRRCQDCHMGRHGHAFPGAHDPTFVRDAVSVCVVDDGDGHVTVRWSTQGVGHRLPTGDPFRHLLLEVCADPDCHTTTAQVRVGRRVETTADSWQIAEDTTLPASVGATSTMTSTTVATAERPRAWRLWMRFGERVLEPKLAKADIGYVLRSGTVCPTGDPACCSPPSP